MKKLLWALVAVAFLAAAGAYVAYNYVDVIVKMALEHWGPDVTGTPVSVQSVKISPHDGSGMVRGVDIGSPAGYSARRAAYFDEVHVAIDPSTLTSPVIVIRDITIEGPRITYERGANRKGVNLDAIQERIEAYAKRSAEGAAEASGPADRLKRRFVIERISIRKGKVLMTSAALKGQGVTFDLPEVSLKDVGKRQGGVTASQAAATVASVLQVKIAEKILTNAELLRKGGIEGAVDALKGLAK